MVLLDDLFDYSLNPRWKNQFVQPALWLNVEDERRVAAGSDGWAYSSRAVAFERLCELRGEYAVLLGFLLSDDCFGRSPKPHLIPGRSRSD
jgi:hypothetical protein